MIKIIIPTDFSETSKNAIYYALELMKYEKCDFTIVHAYATEVYNNTEELSRDYFEKYRDKIKQEADSKLQKIITQMLEKSPNPRHNYKSISIFNSIVESVNDLIKKEEADLVVIGTKGKTNNVNNAFGSNTINLIKYVNCPILSVPLSYKDMHPKHILFPTDYNIPFNKRAFKLVSNIAKNYVCKIHFLYVSTLKKMSYRQEDNKAFLSYCFKDNFIDFFQLPEIDVVKTIEKTIETKNIDLLVMINHRQSYLENMLKNSKIENLELNIKIPFLVLQN
ncbi:universal stress protein [Lacinutrix venerupis]|uniref:Universal stress protein n=1 Tax=Lacinutrix venerupis TaxID=1486034 RepID=A0AAC9LPG9_9FLAO|nr:universal stress protein [Lacinutrix venerupis]APY00497.1 universal stress protein [Lacinutrix venerupis]